MTRYEYGFLTKCAEAGLTADEASVLMRKNAANLKDVISFLRLAGKRALKGFPADVVGGEVYLGRSTNDARINSLLNKLIQQRPRAKYSPYSTPEIDAEIMSRIGRALGTSRKAIKNRLLG